jgi:TetR/AcrR family transcriptional repressor of nem operon
MRYEKGRKEETRRRVIDVASRRFRKDGIEATGVAALMADAGLTHGGFYAHFSSKDELVREALASALQGTRDVLAAAVQSARAQGTDTLEAIVRGYLRPAHRDRPDAGCAVAALAPEVARYDRKSRDVLANMIAEIVAVIAAELPARRRAGTAEETAYAVFGLLIGALQLARVTTDRDLSDQILRSGQEAALALARADS